MDWLLADPPQLDTSQVTNFDVHIVHQNVQPLELNPSSIATS
jgi:hypothetical protein